MSQKYLEICSQYRDRTLYPNPGYFEIPISQSGTKDRKQALDPVCLSTPTLVFNGSFRNDIPSTYVEVSLVHPTSSNTIQNINALSTLMIETTLNSFRREKNFYRGAVIELTQTLGSVTTSIRRRINSYEFVSQDTITPTADQAYITLDIPLPDGIGVTVSALGSINNPTDTILTVKPMIFLPQALIIDGNYQNYYIYNVDMNEYRTVHYFDAEICMVTLDSPAPSWLSTHNYILRKEQPTQNGQLISSTINTATINSVPTSNNSMVGSFIRIYKPVPAYPLSDTIDYGETRRILNYDGQTVTVYPSFSTIPVTGVTSGFEILNFSYDNAQPFVYSGSTVSQQEMVCYEMELNDLILPNTTLAVGTGGLIAFYPYVYVELQNVSASGAGLSNIIYSNNPNSTKMLFRCGIDDIQSPLISRFIKIDSDGMRISLKFKINDNLRFSVRLPNGEIFETIEQDHYSPSPPNPLIQISCMFTLRKV